VLTINGRIGLTRRWWHSSQTCSLAPADALVDRTADGSRRAVREMACRENQGATSFDKAAANLARMAQIVMCGEQLRLIVEAEGRRVQHAQQTAELGVAWAAEDCVVTRQGRKISDKAPVYTGCDGVMVPVITQAEKQKRRTKVKEKRRKCGKKRRPLPPLRQGADQAWKEFKLVYFYDEELPNQHVAAPHSNHVAAGRLMRREANRLGFCRANERVANLDGAPWIREQLEHHLAELDGLGLDFYHLSENVHRARRKVFGEQSPDRSAWTDALLHTFKHEGYHAAWQRLAQWRAQLGRSTTKRKAADRLLNYVSQRQGMIGYPRFRALGWQVGSGPTEAQCKLTIGRLKGRSRRWDRPNAAAIAALDCLERSGQWQTYWRIPCKTAA
jgi:hypothetical protein